MPYIGVSEKLLKKFNCGVGDEIILHAKSGSYQGAIMPRTELGDAYHVVLKLENGYNVGIEVGGSERIEKLNKRAEIGGFHKRKIGFDSKKPTVSIIHTGGTIASKIDYRTGGVVPSFTPEELLDLFPKLGDLTNLRADVASNMFSEDVEMEHCEAMAKKSIKEIKAGTNGILVTHGTDTMYYSSAAVSFMLQNSPIPIIFVGSQRSSDRGSSDAEMNLMSAAHFALESDFSGVGLCMHATMADEECFIHEGTKVRKMHTSRRDAFRSINVLPWARAWPDGKVEFLRTDYPKRDPSRKPILKTGFERKVGLIKAFMSFDPGLIKYFTDKGYKGLVLEGTGLGHVPTNMVDDFTKNHGETLQNLKEFTDNGGVVVMTSSCLYGRINMSVYSTGRDLLNIGVISGNDMSPEVAHIKLKWALGQTKDQEEAKKIMQTNIAGEISERTNPTCYTDQNGLEETRIQSWH